VEAIGVSYEVRTTSTCKRKSPIGVSPVRYEHHLRIKSKVISVNRLWRPIGVSPVRYEHHLHIKSKAIPVRGVSPVRYEHHLHIKKGKAIATDREAYRVVRC
jgi:hypothetical protein